MAGAEHIVQRRYMRSLPTAQAAVQQAPAAGMAPEAALGESSAGPVAAGDKRPRPLEDDALGDPRSSKISKQGDDPAAVASLFDSQPNMYAMEFMRYGDVCTLLGHRTLVCAHYAHLVLRFSICATDTPWNKRSSPMRISGRFSTAVICPSFSPRVLFDD